MATLTNPVNAQNIVDRFADYVTATANAGINRGQNNRHFGDFVAGNMPGVSLSAGGPSIGLPNAEPYVGNAGTGRAIGITGANISATPITASTITTVLASETTQYTSIRRIRALLFVSGGGGNTGSRPTAGVVSDVNDTAYMSQFAFFGGGTGPVSVGTVSSGNAISATALETYFDALRSAYNARARDAASVAANNGTIYVNVCHASCHSNCHGSRGRR